VQINGVKPKARSKKLEAITEMQSVPNIVRERLKAASRAVDHTQVHPDANLLTALAERSLAESERAIVLEHLSHCDDCRDIVALALPAMAPVETATKSPAVAWLTWPALRWGLVTAGILAIAALGVVQYQRRTENTTSKLPSRYEISTKEAKNEPLASPLPANAAKKVDKLSSPAAAASTNSLDARNATGNKATRSLHAEALPAPVLPAGSPPLGGPRMANQRQQQIVVQSQAPAPAAPSPFAKRQAAGALTADLKVPAVSETVEVQGQAAELDTESKNVVMLPIESEKNKDQASAPPAASEQTDSARVGKAKPAEPESYPGDVVAYAVAAPASSSANGTSRLASAAPRWSISSAGSLQRSFDGGTTWQIVDVNANPAYSASATSIQIVGKTSRAKARKVPSPVFRAVAATGTDVWAGGSGGALFHSLDAGDHWVRVTPTSSGAALADDIVSLEFTDMRHGKVSTSTAEVWTTTDAGETWQRQ